MAKRYNEKYTIYWVLAGVLLLLLLGVFGTYLYVLGKSGLPLSIVALICGLLIETKRVSGNWWSTLIIFVVSSVFSLLALIPDSGEFDYVLSSEASTIPFFFIFFFCFFSLVLNSEKYTHKLHEGITFLQSLALIYWLIDFYIGGANSGLTLVLIGLALLFSVYTAYHAFVNKKHTKKSRFYLSIWSSLIMAFFAVNYLIGFVFIESVESASNYKMAFFIALEYFLLGIALIYIVQNLFMLLAFLPGRDSFKKDNYRKELRELRNNHIKRYSNKQQAFQVTLISFIFAALWFLLNYNFKIVERDTAIWILFVLYPFIIYLYRYIFRRFIWA